MKKILALIMAICLASTTTVVGAEVESENQMKECLEVNEIEPVGGMDGEEELLVSERFGGTIDSSVNVNTSYSGNISERYEVRKYKFHLSSPGKINVSFKHANLNNTGRYWVLRIIDAKEETCMSWDSTGIDTNGISMDVGLPAGDYYLQINSDGAEYLCSNYSSELYTFQINYSASDYWEKEVNDDYREATDILLNDWYSGANQFSGDYDYYKIRLSSSGKIAISFTHENLYDSGRYWLIRIYNEQTETVLGWDCYGTDIGINTAEVGLSAGNYYVVVSTDDAEYLCSNYSSSTYSFQVKYQESQYWEAEVNNTFSSANTININTSYSGANQFSNDLDYYKFDLNSSDNIKISFKHKKLSDSGRYWLLRIYDSNTNERASFNITGTDTSFNTGAIALAKGTYFIKISTDDNEYLCSNYSSSTYQLKVSSSVAQTKKVSKPQMSSVKAGKRKATVKWKKVSGASGYEVYMSTKKSKGYKKVKTITKASKVKYVKTGLKKKKTYYFKVCAYKKVNGKKVYGSYSAPKKVKVK